MNLAVRRGFSVEMDLISKINDIMSKVRTLILSPKLRKLNTLRPKLRNETQLSSTYKMCMRYAQLREYLPELNSTDVDEMLLTIGENRTVDSLICRLKDLEPVTKTLQCETTTISNVRALFDVVID